MVRELHCVFVDLERACNKVLREELWYCKRRFEYVRVVWSVQDICEGYKTEVRYAVSAIEEFKVDLGLNQG